MDASQLRRKKRNKAKFSRFLWILPLILITLGGAYHVWRQQRVDLARVRAEDFLQEAGKGEPEKLRDRLFTNGLKRRLPGKVFSKQIELVDRKLGKLRSFSLTRSNLSWFNDRCLLDYSIDMERDRSRALIEMLRLANGNWKVHSFFIRSSKWKKL